MDSVKRLFFELFVNILSASHLTVGKVRKILLNLFGMKIETHLIRSKCYFSSPNISIGKSTFVNNFCKFYSDGHISIGENCFIAMNVLFTANSHEIGPSTFRAGKSLRKPIKVKNGCWIGANVTILPGVTIGEGCVIAAGSVINKDCEPNSLYAGVPAKRIRDLSI